MNEREVVSYKTMLLQGRTVGTPLYTLTDLLWSKEAEHLLHLCEVSPERYGLNASQYDRLCALLDALEMAPGHAVWEHCTLLVHVLLQTSLLPLPQNREALWKRGIECLFDARMTVGDALALLEKNKDCSRAAEDALPAFPNAKTEEISPLFLQYLLESTEKFASWKAWESEMTSRLDGEMTDTFCLELPSGFCFEAPNLYEAEGILKGDGKGFESDLWLCQVARFLSDYCVRRQKIFCLSVLGNGEEACKLLSYLQRSVGLYRLVWMAPQREAQEKLLGLQSEDHQGLWSWGVLPSELPNEAFDAELCRIARQYPVGRLSLVRRL